MTRKISAAKLEALLARGTNLAEGDAITDEMGMTGVADAAGVQSIKVGLGATRAARYSVFAAIDFTGETPTAGQTVDFYWAPSVSGTQATGIAAGADQVGFGVKGTGSIVHLGYDMSSEPAGLRSMVGTYDGATIE
jgi:hypothetical protein|tara:strand:- start:110 stop:517 length:408 start_codon:yes stop_codon:yes gene_type:complete